MNIQHIITASIPNVGLKHLLSNYLNWAGVGFISAILAGVLDQHADVPYAANYISAVNEAIGFKFWLLLVAIGTLLLCLCGPIFYWRISMVSCYTFPSS
jgi:hypothetical protein